MSSLLQLPILSCAALSGDQHMAATLSDVWKSLYKSAHLIDTVEDEEFLPSSGRNIGLKVNEACQLIFSAELILAQLEEMGIPPGTASTLRIKLNRSILT